MYEPIFGEYRIIQARRAQYNKQLITYVATI